MPTKEQQRAAYALSMINTQFNGHVDEETANFIVGTPTMILTNGLGQSLAFLVSKNESEKHRKAFQILCGWLRQEVPALSRAAGDMQFLNAFAALEQDAYLHAQHEALAVLAWLKRYARAFEG